MRLITVPNVSEGRSAAAVDEMVAIVTRTGAAVLDVHRDAVHNRSVLTVGGDGLIPAMTALAERCKSIDMTSHEGVHPRLGGLDVCPFVPVDGDLPLAVEAATAAAAEIGALGIPVYLYGAAATRPETTELPDLRRGGLAGLAERARRGLRPDAGPAAIDPTVGVCCVGARTTLIAFNVWLDAPVDVARTIAQAVRSSTVRALGLDLGGNRSQVSMNLIDPEVTGIEEAFGVVAAAAGSHGRDVLATELVGLVPERFLPEPTTETARLLIEPGRSLESVLRD